MICSFSLIAQVDSFSGESAFGFLEKQCSFGPRNPGSDGHSACLAFLENELKKYSDKVSKQKFYHKDRYSGKNIKMYNVFARFRGTQPGAQGILLAAHWDTRPVADRDPDPANRSIPIIGANDGASGVAVLLEIARKMSKYPPPVPVDILLTDGEDYGKEGENQDYFLGARHFIKKPPRKPYIFGILLDMIGDRDLRILKEAYSLEMMPDLVNSVWKRAREMELKAFKIGTEKYVIDEHRILIEAGIPIIDIIDFNYKYWHTLEDTPDKCSSESLEQVGRLVLSLIYEGLKLY